MLLQHTGFPREHKSTECDSNRQKCREHLYLLIAPTFHFNRERSLFHNFSDTDQSDSYMTNSNFKEV